MAPNITSSPTGVLFEGETLDESSRVIDAPKTKYKRQIVWRNVIIFAYLHIGAVYGLYLALTSAKWATLLFGEWKPENIFRRLPNTDIYNIL